MTNANANFTLKGVPQLEMRLAALHHDLSAGRGLYAALRAAALPIQNEWKRLAPYKTGTYKRSIHTEIQPAGPEAIIGTDITNPPYPAYLEFGTSKMDPHPSMRPAFWVKEHAAVEAFANAIKKVLFKYGAV